MLGRRFRSVLLRTMPPRRERSPVSLRTPRFRDRWREEGEEVPPHPSSASREIGGCHLPLEGKAFGRDGDEILRFAPRSHDKFGACQRADLPYIVEVFPRSLNSEFHIPNPALTSRPHPDAKLLSGLGADGDLHRTSVLVPGGKDVAGHRAPAGTAEDHPYT